MVYPTQFREVNVTRRSSIRCSQLDNQNPGLGTASGVPSIGDRRSGQSFERSAGSLFHGARDRQAFFGRGNSFGFHLKFAVFSGSTPCSEPATRQRSGLGQNNPRRRTQTLAVIRPDESDASEFGDSCLLSMQR